MLLCAYAPHYLDAQARSGWQQDAAPFSGWLSDFEVACRSLHAVSAARVPLELLRVLEGHSGLRPPLLLVGFDRLVPVQRGVLEAWGRWSEALPDAVAAHVRLYELPDTQAELAACALWCRGKWPQIRARACWWWRRASSRGAGDRAGLSGDMGAATIPDRNSSFPWGCRSAAWLLAMSLQIPGAALAGRPASGAGDRLAFVDRTVHERRRRTVCVDRVHAGAATERSATHKLGARALPGAARWSGTARSVGGTDD